MKYAKSEKEYITKYQKLGYTRNYSTKNNNLIDLASKKQYAPDEVVIENEIRFEGMSNPSDMSILYIIETKDGNKGTVLANYSPSSATEIAEFFNAIPKENNKTQENV
ncbi:hypothetical protein [Cellulophaga tyrosinoxydans]|uniref:Phosphoribosylpyrophosphate synthetase n=1 Tax=Cellulophaga tyrosinoxydans TaxID=504486 RepID=A0A1W1YL34_9FLAO|nr:hypothetical protein [Cellulophaga tyrosinoxydans]SMC36521.1 hypothetical protein SAMN05660703_0575 [Cellulophaga tyrosinoxydans]